MPSPGVLVPPGVVTVTVTEPDPLGAFAKTWLSESTVTPVAATAPKRTVLVRVRLVPLMVTVFPPESGPCSPRGRSPAGRQRAERRNRDIGVGEAVARARCRDDCDVHRPEARRRGGDDLGGADHRERGRGSSEPDGGDPGETTAVDRYRRASRDRVPVRVRVIPLWL